VSTVLHVSGLGEGYWIDVDDDPRVAPGPHLNGQPLNAPRGSVAKDNIGQLWQKNGDNILDWSLIITGSNSTTYSVPPGYIFGMVPKWLSTSQITINKGFAQDDTDAESIEILSILTLDITTNGLLGLDTGTVASDTWYYVWVIKIPNTSTVSAIISASYTTPTLPAGYTLKRLLPFAMRADGSSEILRFIVRSGWPSHPAIYFQTSFTSNVTDQTYVLDGGGAVVWTLVDCSSYVPPISSVVYLYASSEQTKILSLRPPGITTAQLDVRGGIANQPFPTLDIGTNNLQEIEYVTEPANAGVFLAVRGFVITEDF